MSFHSPHLLWLLVPLVLLFSWELARHTARAAVTWPKIARAWAGAFDVSLGARHTTAENRPRIWLWFGLALCIVALARPQWGTVEEKIFDQSREVLIAVDLSRSMLAQDVKPSRLERSKLLIQSLLDHLKGERVGLVLFAGTAFLQNPLSSDYEVLREFLPALAPDFLPEGGSNYAAMLETSMQAFGTSTADRYLIVLSDGESTTEDWKRLTEPLKQKGVRVIGLGVGTTQGSFIPDAAGGLVKDERGAVVLSRLNSATLEELAQITGGAYADASRWIDLPALLAKTIEAGRKGEFVSKNTARRIERFQWFLAPGLLLLLVSFWAEFPIRPRERSLPLARRAAPGPGRTRLGAASAAVGTLLLAVAAAASRADAAEPPSDTLAKPLTTAVARLAEQDRLSAKDCAELAQTTVTFGQRSRSAQQTAPEGVVRDALQAVDLGESLDARAADWPRLRRELHDLLQTEPPPKQDQPKPDQPKPQDKKDQPQNPDQPQPDQPQPDPGKSGQDHSDQPRQEQASSAPKEDAFGDMKDQAVADRPKEPAPKPGTQKVGGQPDRPTEPPPHPELAVPLQKLEQVRDQDSPSRLQQLLQGRQTKPRPPGKDW
ncbi:MAG: VWA domain-containing protein [Opitutaceae bacterium]|nr:VWA domain-containing protein [Opitutaceae bacterium]